MREISFCLFFSSQFLDFIFNWYLVIVVSMVVVVVIVIVTDADVEGKRVKET